MFRLAASAVLGFAAFVGSAHADDAAIRKALEPKLGGVRIDAILPTPIPGLFEIQFRTQSGVQVIYSDSSGNYAIQGSMYDFRSDRNLTEEKLRKLNVVKFDSLPLDLAVKIQRGNGKRVMAMFSDPYCPYCQQFEKTLQQIDDVTIYVFMYPIIRPQNADHSKAVWCSSDRAKAWLDLALQAKRPAAAATCDNPVDKVLELGRSLRINSTPTLILANGERIAGGLPAADMRDVLDQASVAPALKKRQSLP
jgi:thiol:disulfide interchange protein DsbC